MLYHIELGQSSGNRRCAPPHQTRLFRWAPAHPAATMGSLCYGRMYTPDGTLALSVVQEGLVRPLAKPKL